MDTELPQPKTLICFVAIFIAFVSCGTPHDDRRIIWRQYSPTLGTSSSPHCADLNGDGILDVVIGAGKNEYEFSDSAVIAFDGASGSVLWLASAKDQIVGSPTFIRINNDQVPDVIIGGRGVQLMAIDGANGQLIWRFELPEKQEGFHWFNFSSSQIIPDQDDDGVDDILVANGGNPHAEPFSEKRRYPGLLAVLSAKTGRVIASDTMPDGRETYMSPVLHDFEKNGELSIIYGTGGETLGGTLYKASLKNLLSGNLSSSQVIQKREGKGFIAPVVLTDITSDGTRDIICNTFGGEILAIDGKDLHMLWTVKIPDTEMYNTVTPGHINTDGIPDFFNTFNMGAWPANTGTIHVVVDGATGKIAYQDTVGCSGYASALAYDMNGDGFDEFIWNTNEYKCDGIFLAQVDYRLMALDVQTRTLKEIVPKIRAKNVSSTPWLGDLDGNGRLDIVYCIQKNTSQIHTYFGMQLERVEFNVPAKSQVPWGEYMGHDGKSIF